ncbi:MAG: efflux RND transporter permease subunit [Cytophagales bacterium]|nr:efflux RND transporter permease subunit [Cytophagales bacterium]
MKLSSFSIILIFICLSIMGAGLIPKLTVQLKPSRSTSGLSVSYSWRGASPKVLEQQVTSKLEGAFNRIRGVRSISSTSRKGSGSIWIGFKKNTNMDAVRFELSSLIRRIYPELPKGVSYPHLSKSSSNEGQSPILSYSVQANTTPFEIKKYVERKITPKLVELPGVNRVSVYGATPYEWEIEYDSEALRVLGLSVWDIRSAISTHFESRELGTAMFQPPGEKNPNSMSVVLRFRGKEEVDWESIPVRKTGERLVYLRDVASVRYKQAAVNSYYRINGQNTVSMVIYPEAGVNTVEVAKEARKRIENLDPEILNGYGLMLTSDSTEHVVNELQKIQKRTLYSLLILLVLILVLNRNMRYLAILLLSIVSNLLIAVLFYYGLQIELQLYSFAGITISFGIIIDNSIIMIDHLRHKGNKKAFLAILAATLTTIGALVVIFFLKESQRVNLMDFAWVIAINIGVSLFVSLFFVPALMERIPIKKGKSRVFVRRKKRVVKVTNLYKKWVLLTKKRPVQWAFALLLILGFGLPVHRLPTEIKKGKKEKELSSWASFYNKTLGSEWFVNEMRPAVEKALGGTLRLFSQHVFENSYYSEPERTVLRIRGSMPEGCTVEQLNVAVRKMEQFISEYEEVEMFETRINGYRSSSITVYFKEEHEWGSFPYLLKSRAESKANNLGGMDWSVAGVGRGFSNAMYLGYKSNRIRLEGYNYDQLFDYATMLSEHLKKASARVRAVEISTGGWRTSALREFYLDFDLERLAKEEIPMRSLYSLLDSRIHQSGLPSVFRNNEMEQVKLVADQRESFNVWDMKNQPLSQGSRQYKLHELAEIDKRKTGDQIKKENQQYQLTVAYDFLGPHALSSRVEKRERKWMSEQLPMGYRVKPGRSWGWNRGDKTQYYYLFLVIGIIFFICAIVLESLRQAWVVISLIPASFIGVFLTFYLFEFNFDQGGYASFILLCGISVNSALYILNDWNNLQREQPGQDLLSLYFKAFNTKIIPVILTIVSTFAGLVPFVWHGQKEVFWFAFAAGAIGGLLFSLLAIFIYLPMFIVRRKMIRSRIKKPEKALEVV